ncbi:MAG TPA: phospholipase D-like domain-containing protein [Solirubrobacteraceae bacterium]|jgi:phosphatidylserine/phosphatidylglycerophosphate/cardiolipin synthase-like enzyme|nr:phospholipase D-like domain-containing protein [Solirubrobacteraceae bacterium]
MSRRRVGVLAGVCIAGIAGLVVGAESVAFGSSAQAPAAVYYRLVQYPDAGFGGFYRQIALARRTIDMEIYEFADPVAERDLAAAAARGVHVRILLDKDFNGGGVNREAAQYLAARGVDVRWAPPGYIFHIKTTTFDGAVSDISTANLDAKYYRTTRDAEVIDSNPVQVHAIESTFSNDWTAGASGTPRFQTVQAPGLIWSPNTGSGTAETALVREIRSARTSVDFESEELADPAIYGALASDARRGVSCRVVMTRTSEWDTAFRAISQAGCHVRLFPDSSTALYIHEKLILDDPAAASESMLIGSQNASVTSLTRNRELGILLARTHGGSSVIAMASATFNSDFQHASPWPASPAKPKPTPTPSPTPTPTSCYPTSSSGNCYEPGEYCSDADHGMSGVAGDGEPIVCEDNDGWRWEPK